MTSRRFHMILDAENCDPKKLIDHSFLEWLIVRTADKINMNILFGPVIKDGIPENPGVSAFCIIDFSHISIHTFTDTNEFNLDIFSCKPFDYQAIYRFIKDTFALRNEDIRRGLVYYNNKPVIHDD